ncbi:MAG TPA: ATP-binding protein [Steroidobacteraceae bacterium]|nr:ATP-binding protein [Steroidobacteraceae bacterium]
MSTSAQRRKDDEGLPIDEAGLAQDAILKNSAQGILFVDAADCVMPQASTAAYALLRRRDFTDVRFQDLLRPLLGDKAVATIQATLAGLRAEAAVDAGAGIGVEVRMPNGDGSLPTAFYRFEFRTVAERSARGLIMVSIADETAFVQQSRELADLRIEVQTQAELLRSILHMGPVRFAASVKKTDAAMAAINRILKKPAREQAAFRNKLEETLDEVDRIRREGAALKLSALENAARMFEDSLLELRSRSTLSGGDFLPLAVKLDELFGQFALLRSLTKNAQPQPTEAGASFAGRLTQNGTQIIDAPRFIAALQTCEKPPLARAAARAGKLENALLALTEHIAAEFTRSAALECSGLEQVPAAYQATVKNVAVQLIRNALIHGVEAPPERLQRRKPARAALRLTFKSLPDGSFDMRFADDGRGIDPQLIRETAAAKGLISRADAAALGDRQAIKLIFKSGFTTLPPGADGPPHGAGLALVRRYIDEAGGKIALASLLGHDTRFKISLPACPSAAADAG